MILSLIDELNLTLLNLVHFLKLNKDELDMKKRNDIIISQYNQIFANGPGSRVQF